jgi:2,4-dienoyl-CoA reductase-like NADH-dependent reductase (Old Yellow Enzyme family)
LSDDEFAWLTLRARGGFGLVMTCAAHVQGVGQGFPGQLGVFSDAHLPGLERLAQEIKAHGALAAVQLHHAGIRSPSDLIGAQPVGPSEDAETGARGLSEGEVEALVEDFIVAAVRAEKAGFDAAELHGAHGYILCAFLSAETNRRADRFGGSLENRARVVREIIHGVRARTGPQFQLGLRLSPERFGLRLDEQRALAGELLAEGALDWLDMSLWSTFKPPMEAAYAERPLIDWFTDLPRGETRLGVAGKLLTAADCCRALENGADFVLLGRAAILHHDFPRRAATDPEFATRDLPVSPAYLRAEGLGPTFIDYMRNWKGFVADAEPLAATA